jgi:ribosomal protein S8E
VENKNGRQANEMASMKPTYARKLRVKRNVELGSEPIKQICELVNCWRAEGRGRRRKLTRQYKGPQLSSKHSSCTKIKIGRITKIMRE